MVAFLFTLASMMCALNIYVVYGGSQGEQSIISIVTLIGICLAASLIGGTPSSPEIRRLNRSSPLVSLLTWVIPSLLIFFFGAYIGAFVGLSLLSMGYTGMSLYGFLFVFSCAYIGGVLSLLWEDLFWSVGYAFNVVVVVVVVVIVVAFSCLLCSLPVLRCSAV
jgi:hypothetical protein